MPLLQPKITGDNVIDQWSEEVTYLVNSNEILAAAALTGATGSTDLGVTQELVPVYADDAMGTNQSLELGDRMFVYYTVANVGEDPVLPIVDRMFVQFRGEQTRSVEITIKEAPSSYVNLLGVTRDYTDWDTLVSDWSTGAIEIDAFDDDPDGFDFSFRADRKLLFARVAKASQSVQPSDAYEGAAVSRAFDYTWTRNGMPFTPTITDVTTELPFLYIQAEDAIDTTAGDEGISSQFFCNIVQA